MSSAITPQSLGGKHADALSKNSWLFYHGLYSFLSFNSLLFILQLLLLSNQTEGFINQIHLPTFVYGEIITTLIIQWALVLISSVAQALLFLLLYPRRFLQLTGNKLILILWMLSTLALLLANYYYFPLSITSKILVQFVNPQVLHSLMILAFGLMAYAVLLAIWQLRLKTIGGLMLLTLVNYCFLHWGQLQMQVKALYQQNPASSMNVILLGIDSLNPEDITPQSMPYLHQLLKKSTVFTHSISPLARTFPAWCTLLTGLYPKHHQALYNLMPKKKVKSELSIAWAFKKQGYYTLFATDDRRFNNLDETFGFQQILGPKTGVNDVILGTYNDFPLGNLLINSALGPYLFPYNAYNRASSFSYYPQSFSQLLIDTIKSLPKQQPAFLAVHFALPHWPYNWAESHASMMDENTSPQVSFKLHQQALLSVDQQIKAYYQILADKKRLDNSLLVFLSDHGETFFLKGSRPLSAKGYQGDNPGLVAKYFRHETSTTLNKSAGHGSDLLSPKQYHTLLAFQIRKNNQLQTPVSQIVTPVSLLDLAPTMAAYAKIAEPIQSDGISLIPAILGKPLRARSFFIESGMFPNKALNKKEAVKLGAKVFSVNTQSGELEIKEAILPKLNQEKLHGIIRGSWVLALYPNPFKIPFILQNIKTNQWSDTHKSDLFVQGNGQLLLTRLHQFLQD